ncbi:MAG: Spx/MgsR family RNA polymerase-binding regulatory protein [Planctomycetota bacterium]|nr:MAG: Spx/MgsR family RNA polymerase-binding regulatory protein [Planctomycetota bacterium]
MEMFGYRQCGTCRKAQQWLREHGHEIAMKPIRDTPPTVSQLRSMLEYLGGNRKRLINTSSKDYRESGLKDRLSDLSDDALMRELRSNGNLIKRPFLLCDGGGTTGFKEDEWRELLGPLPS